jgi:hypothetical protein
VPEVVVDQLEVVEVEQQHGSGQVAGGRDGLLQPLAEHDPVGQAGQ